MKDLFNNQDVKIVRPFLFSDAQINTFSKLRKCKLHINKNSFTVNDKNVFKFKDIYDIKLIKTTVDYSNKGWVIKVMFNDKKELCFSFGNPKILHSAHTADFVKSNNLYVDFCKRWHQEKKLIFFE